MFSSSLADQATLPLWVGKLVLGIVGVIMPMRECGDWGMVGDCLPWLTAYTVHVL